jgi:hypothetical protein
MSLSFLYAVLIALIVVELAVVAWTVNFLRKYAFRPNPGSVDGHEAPEWRQRMPEWQRVAFARPAGNDSRQDAAERFARAREANRRH